MINYICIYGKSEKIENIHIQKENKNLNIMSDTWTTNCFGIDMIALSTDTISTDRMKELSKSFKLISNPEIFYFYAKIIMGLSNNWIHKFVYSPTTNILGSLGIEIEKIKNDWGDTDSSSGYALVDFFKKYTILKIAPLDINQLSETIFLVDVDRVDLNQLPDIYTAGKIILDDRKSSGKENTSRKIISNDDSSILIGQAKTLMKLFDPNTFDEPLKDLKFFNSKLVKRPVSLIGMYATFRDIEIINLSDLDK